LFRNVHVVSASGGAATPITFLANTFGGAVSWSPDGTFILFDTRQRTEDGQVARVDLVPRVPKFREDQFRDLFKEEPPKNASPAPPGQETRPPQREGAASADEPKKPAAKPVDIVFEGIRRRLSLVPVGIDVGSQTISPDGKWLLMTADAAGQQNLYVYSLDELAREPAVARQLTSTAGNKGQAQFSPDSKEVFYLEQGRINVVTVESRQTRALAVTAEMDVDFSREKLDVFRQAWTYLRDHFYDPNFHGADWPAVRAAYGPRIAGARTPDEMRRVISLMVGELNASHLGISGPPGGAPPSTGKLGLRFDRAQYESAGRLRVTEVIQLGPAALAGIKPGEYLLAIDGAELNARANLDSVLGFKAGRRVTVTVSSAPDGADKRDVVVRPVGLGAEKGLLYRQWVDENRDYVARASNGRLGYVHMPDMGAGSLAQLYVDLDVENHSRDGVVIDIRNNNGGFVNVYAIDVLARRGYLTMTPRNQPSAPARTNLGQRALEAPTILVINQHSLSDAEDFTEGYRALKLGKVVGEPTAGWIIYTTNVTLLDGSSLRIPFIKIQGSDGAVMELNPRPVDIPVVRPIGESYTDRDSQLDAAVRALIEQIRK
jgi:C-terminal processing protease CtpA/Prc